MQETARQIIVGQLAESIDIPDGAYKKAEARYKELGEWFGRKEAICFPHNPHIYSQGSFRLGTVIRPVTSDGEYDLDMGCRLRIGVTKKTHTQERLKEMVRQDVEAYRKAKGIEQKMEEKHRCWRLKYKDELPFHLDIVPSIPEAPERQFLIREAIIRGGQPQDLAELVAKLTGAITDNSAYNYKFVDENWPQSNSEGFARWFEFRMRLAKAFLQNRAVLAGKSKVEELPVYQWKSPLQGAVQILKSHRDICFADNPDGKAASIIITTLAARAYEGEADITEAVDNILARMGALVSPKRPRVPNPVNPAEDFSDRWTSASGVEHNLEKNFWDWLRRAQEDFGIFKTERRVNQIVAIARTKFGASINEKDLSEKLNRAGGGGLLRSAVVSSGLSFPDKPVVPQKPAGFA
ncbi:MAG: hypothetical protein JWM16_5377 [Verrucomicrobiales bacterium]|nr:hypothetical protein [Verrucomicrobiales bacterium]